MGRTSITAKHAAELTERMKAAARDGSLLDLTMPNGKKLRDCTGGYVRQMGEAMDEIGRIMETANSLRSKQKRSS